MNRMYAQFVGSIRSNFAPHMTIAPCADGKMTQCKQNIRIG